MHEITQRDYLSVNEQYQQAHIMTELSSDNLDIVNIRTSSVDDEVASTLDYPFYQPSGSNLNTFGQDMFNPFLQFSQLQNGVETQTYLPEWGACHSQPHEDLSPPVSNDGLDSNALNSGLYNKCEDGSYSPRDMNCQQSPAPSAPARGRRLRRQNHACDTCRSSKKACDLALIISIGRHYRVSKYCTTCRIRGVECTARWLSDKLAMKQAKHRASITEQSRLYSRMAANNQKPMQAASSSPTTTSAPEAELVRSFMAQSNYSENFQLYVHCFDRPVTQCLLGGSMPPQFSLGISAYIPLRSSPQVSAYVKQANSWIETCWPASLSNRADPASTDPTPHLLSAVCVLDSLFNSKCSQSKGQSISSRDILITDAYKWVAAAIASQFVLRNMEHPDEESGRKIDEVQMRKLQDAAHAAWCKARDVLFRCIAATKSFRLATSLMLFGLIDPVGNSSVDTQLRKEDSRYALYEGLSRLQSLITHARSRLQASEGMVEYQDLTGSQSHNLVHDLASTDRENLLELIGAIEWMVSLINSIVIGTSKGTICPLPFDNSTAVEGTRNGNCRENGESSAPLESEIQELILARTNDGLKSTALCQELGDEDTMTWVLGEASSILIALWKSLARFTMGIKTANYDLISRWYATTTTLIDLWRDLFGSLGPNSKLKFRTPGCRRIFALYSIDADVAILLFYEAVRKLEARLSIQSSNSAEEMLADTIQAAITHHKEQRLVSAIMISVIVASYNDTTSIENPTSTVVADSIGVHPLPRMVVQAHTLAAEVFADELHDMFTSSIDATRTKEMAAGLEICLNGLNTLRQTLICFSKRNSSSTLLPEA